MFSFYVFEVMLVPMYFIIGGGNPARDLCGHKVCAFHHGGSLLMLVAILIFTLPRERYREYTLIF
jgi:NADH:ubiquinone oxidoreductase subunit 4 (subunit M)